MTFGLLWHRGLSSDRGAWGRRRAAASLHNVGRRRGAAPPSAGSRGAAYMVAERAAVGVPAPLAAAVVVASALGFSYPLPLAVRDGATEKKDGMAEQFPTSLDERIEHADGDPHGLARRPGLARLRRRRGSHGEFDRLPQSSKLIHLSGVGFVMMATILLMAPASRHRITERGEASEVLQQFTSQMLLAAMAALALSVAAQALVLVRRVHDSLPVAAAAAAGLDLGMTAKLTTSMNR
jgi:Family of unknown function (DUF6328)